MLRAITYGSRGVIMNENNNIYDLCISEEDITEAWRADSHGSIAYKQFRYNYLAARLDKILEMERKKLGIISEGNKH